MRKKSIILFIVLLSLCLVQCTKQKKIRVGVITKLESGSLVGSSEINAAKLFFEKHHISNLEIIPFNDSWNPMKTKKAYKEALANEVDVLITSHVSTCANRISKDINHDKILTLLTGATTDEISNRDDYLFRVIPDVNEEQKSIARYINHLKGNNVLVIRDTENCGYTKPALHYFQQYLTKRNTRIIEIGISKLELASLEKQIRKSHYDIVYLLIGGYKSNAGSIAQLCIKVKPHTTIMYTPWMKNSRFIGNSRSFHS